MSQKLNKNIQQFERAKLKKISELLFDLSKNTAIGGFAYFIFDSWEQPTVNGYVSIVSSISSLLFFNLGLLYLKKYYLKKHE